MEAVREAYSAKDLILTFFFVRYTSCLAIDDFKSKFNSSLLQGFGMTGGAAKLGGIGGMIGNYFGESKVKKCLKKVRNYTKSQV